MDERERIENDKLGQGLTPDMPGGDDAGESAGAMPIPNPNDAVVAPRPPQSE